MLKDFRSLKIPIVRFFAVVLKKSDVYPIFSPSKISDICGLCIMDCDSGQLVYLMFRVS